MSTSGELLLVGEGYEGWIADLAFDTAISLEPNERKTNDNHPDFLVTGKSPRNRDIEIGAAWRKISQAGNGYLSLSLNILSKVHRVNAVKIGDDTDTLYIRPWAESGPQG